VPPQTASEYCLIAKPITYSEPHGSDVETADNNYDSAETLKQVKDHDLKFESVCPQKQ
jgi:hypothetical protein